jgi:DNA-binding MarR family transcriptional regulator
MHDTARKLIATCACHRIRMAARAVTRAYDEALRPAGLRATQLSVLAAIAAEGALSISALAASVGMDRSTLTRNLAPLRSQGLVGVGEEGWRRSRTLRVTAKGRARLERAVPLWERAQKRLQRELGAGSWAEVQTGLDHLIHHTKGDPT